MASYQLTAEAISDLFDIWNYINRDNSEAADRVEEAILGACDFLPIPHSQVT